MQVNDLAVNDLAAFVAVARAGGFRDAARSGGVSPASLSVAVRRLETRLGLRLLNRTTRSVAPTEAGPRLLDRLGPLFGEMEAALDALNAFRDKPSGTLRLNVPAGVARIVLPRILASFLQTYPDIRVEVVVEDSFVDVLAAGCDAGIRYDDRLAQDMIAVPIGPRTQRFATAAAPVYLQTRGKPRHPRDLLKHACLRGQFAGGAMPTWDFERQGRSCGSTRRHRWWCAPAWPSTWPSAARSPGSAWCTSMRRAARAAGQRRARAGAATVVAALLRPVSLLSGAPARAQPAARLRRLREGAPRGLSTRSA